MKGMFARIRSRIMLVILSIGLVVGGQTWAQTAFIDYEKSILLSKFVKYIEWPPESDQPTFVIGIYDDIEKHLYFSEFFANKGVRGKDITVRLIKTSTEAKEVHILYVPSPNKRRTSKLTTKIINEANVLVVTEGSKELSKTMIDLSYNEQTSKIGFSVVDDNIAKGNLILPDLSKFTDNNDDVLSVSPSFAKKNKQANQLLALQKEVAKQKSTLDQLNDKLILSNEKAEKQLLTLEKESERLNSAQQTSDKQRKEIDEQNEKLQRLEEQLQAQETELNMSKGDLQLAAEEKAIEQEVAITELTEQLNQQNQANKNTALKLTNMTDENQRLSIFKVLFFVFIVVALAALFAAFTMWKKAKSAALQPAMASTVDDDSLLSLREEQLIKSENLAALGYIATDVTYALGASLEELHEQLTSSGDTEHANALKPLVTRLDNLNLIAADQDDTESQRFDVIAYIQKMLMLYDVEFSQSNIGYSYSGDTELTISAVPSYVALIVLNVVNNALKHGFDNNGNGKITLNVKKSAKGGATITFTDNGKGMSKDVLAQVFTPFYTTASDRGYIGAGMSNTYDLVKNKLSGDISIDSKVGKGTTVTVNLP